MRVMEGASPFLSGLVHFFTRWMLSLANFLRGWMRWALTSDIVPSVCAKMSKSAFNLGQPREHI